MDRWDLSPLYESFDSPVFKNDMELVKKYIEEINAIPNLNCSPEEKAEKYIAVQNDFQDKAERLIEYAALRTSADRGDDEAFKYLDMLENILT